MNQAHAPEGASKRPHPYSALPRYAFWNRSVAGVPPFAVDPVVDVPFRISPSDAVATAGSCFAQHIARALQKNRFRYFVSEPAPPGLSPEAAAAANYVFSARYGNIYTTRQLLQLFDRAYGVFSPSLSAASQPSAFPITTHFAPLFHPPVKMPWPWSRLTGAAASTIN